MNGKNGKAICQWWEISKYLAVIDLVALGGLLITHCITFFDASEYICVKATYLRMVNDLEEVHCSLIFGKSRVAPVKYVSILRLELKAATLSVKISMMLREELDIHISSEVFWTGSLVALGYITNDSQRCKIFVANCVQFI